MRVKRTATVLLLTLLLAAEPASAGGGGWAPYAADGALADQSVLPPEAVWADLVPGAAPWRHRKSGDPTPPACYREGAPLTPNCLAEVVIVSEIMSAFVGRTSLERRLSRLKIGADIGGAAVAKPHGRGFNEAIRAAGVERDIDFYYKIDVWDPQPETYSSRYHNWRNAQVGVTFYTAFCLPPALSRG